MEPMAAIESVNVGTPREVTWNRQTFTTAIHKVPMVGRLPVRGVNIEGDDQADRSVHGGESKAIYAYASEDYEWWAREHDVESEPGLFGENLTLSGVELNECLIGERWQVGSTVLEVSEPRLPCFKLAYRMNDNHFIKVFSSALRTGTYFRIVTDGEVAAGDRATLVSKPSDHDVSVRDVARIYVYDRGERSRLLHVSALSAKWQDWAREG
jgi:MOSC domain-containing protein YiiM